MNDIVLTWYDRKVCRTCGATWIVSKLDRQGCRCHSDQVTKHKVEPNGTIFVWDERPYGNDEGILGIRADRFPILTQKPIAMEWCTPGSIFVWDENEEG